MRFRRTFSVDITNTNIPVVAVVQTFSNIKLAFALVAIDTDSDTFGAL